MRPKIFSGTLITCRLIANINNLTFGVSCANLGGASLIRKNKRAVGIRRSQGCRFIFQNSIYISPDGWLEIKAEGGSKNSCSLAHKSHQIRFSLARAHDSICLIAPSAKLSHCRRVARHRNGWSSKSSPSRISETIIFAA